ncbi:hypothetical protein [Gordonia sp. NPDC003429]
MTVTAERQMGVREPITTPAAIDYRIPNGIAMERIHDRLYGTVAFSRQHEGRPGWTNATAVAALLTELVQGAVLPRHLDARETRLAIDYFAPVPVLERIALRTWITHRAGREISAIATMHMGPRILAHCQGSFCIDDVAEPDVVSR